MILPIRNLDKLGESVKIFCENPGGVIEEIGQNMNAKYNSIYYTVGSLSPEIALLVATKGIGTGLKKELKQQAR